MPKFYTDKPKDGKVRMFDVMSKTTPGVTYKMRIFPDGEIMCGCPWNSIKSKECSHIREYLSLGKGAKE